jgi:hypothetical protein
MPAGGLLIGGGGLLVFFDEVVFPGGAGLEAG